MKLSGPVEAYICNAFGYEYRFYADIHNDTSGYCDDTCHTYDYNVEVATCNKLQQIDSCNNECYDFPRYIVERLSQPIHFYLEYSYVCDDADAQQLEKPHDYIDRITLAIFDTLQKTKRHTYAAKVHYVDVRDMFVDNPRLLLRANPLCGSWCNSYDGNIVEAAHRILNFAWQIYDWYMYSIVPQSVPQICDEWQSYYNNMLTLTSTYNGRKVCRVHKQLLRLTDPQPIYVYIHNKFDSILQRSLQRIHNATVDDVQMLLVPLSSCIMDAYTLARMCRYHGDTIVFAGLAHIHTYIDFFANVIGCTIEHQQQNDMRCVSCNIIRDEDSQ